MKSFFKKLAFVMALAMVVTLAAPAAQAAVAADEKKPLAITYQKENTYTISEVNLAKVGDTEDLKFLWAPTNWKELGVKWTSSNENIVTVDGNGLITAVAAGEATVSVAVGTETAAVKVNVGVTAGDLPVYPCNIGLTSAEPVTTYTLTEGETVDFAFFGIKDYGRDELANGSPRYFCQWFSSVPGVAEVDQKGFVTAKTAGTAIISLYIRNGQTTKEYTAVPVTITVKAKEAPVVENSITVINDKDKNYNLTEDEIKILFALDTDLSTLVKNEEVELYHVFVADDDADADGFIDATGVQYEFGYEKVFIDTVTKGDDLKTWTLKTFDDLLDGEKYEIRINKKLVKQFTASVGQIADIDLKEETQAQLAKTEDESSLTPSKVVAKLYDKNGVELTDYVVDGVANDDYYNLTYKLANENDEDYTMSQIDNYASTEFYAADYATIVASWNDGTLAEAVTDEITITPSGTNAYYIVKVVEWSFVKEGAATDYTKTRHYIPAGEEGFVIDTLMLDSRGNYVTTHYPSSTAGSPDGKNKYNGQTIYWTEDPEFDFWINGLYVKYRAYYDDTMLINEGGGVATYEEVKGTARYGLDLYDQNLDGNQKVRTIYSQNVTICHEAEMTGFNVANTTITGQNYIMKNTEADDKEAYGTASDNENAYFSLFSTGTVKVTFTEKHDEIGVYDIDDELAAADFEVILTSEKDNAALLAYLEGKVAAWVGHTAAEAKAGLTFTYTADELRAVTSLNTVNFTLKELVTGRTQKVTLKMIESVMDGASAKVATVTEFTDGVQNKVGQEFEKYALSGALATKYVRDVEKKYAADIATLLLTQPDMKGYAIGYENNICIADTVSARMTTANIVEGTPVVGARVITIKAPNGKAFIPGTEFKNADFNAKAPAAYATPASTTAVGVTVNATAKTATSASGDSINIAGYDFLFVDNTTSGTGELIFAPVGTYTIYVRTIEAIEADGTINFTENTALTKTMSFKVEDNRDYVEYVDRKFINVYEQDVFASETLASCGLLDAVNPEKPLSLATGDDPKMKQIIEAAFVFDDETLTTNANILYYTYSVAPTNNQVIVNSVVFKYQLDDGWYRSEVKVNKHLNFVD